VERLGYQLTVPVSHLQEFYFITLTALQFPSGTGAALFLESCGKVLIFSLKFADSGHRFLYSPRPVDVNKRRGGQNFDV
jgi:hypothetical protein